ncbi:hypothetical protein J8A90_23475, partial [Vibrio parahaemolyticus]|nr:hypothetical protein [Vibrio parahaemolyticus]
VVCKTTFSNWKVSRQPPMSKHPNPIRGHVSCPVCHTASTVHRVGEGKLIAEGEPTKNGRNLGLLYYWKVSRQPPMSKHPNPIRGHVSCPVCHTASTVHRVGEGKLIAEGEPTKNGRNLGLLYYKEA